MDEFIYFLFIYIFYNIRNTTNTNVLCVYVLYKIMFNDIGVTKQCFRSFVCNSSSRSKLITDVTAILYTLSVCILPLTWIICNCVTRKLESFNQNLKIVYICPISIRLRYFFLRANLRPRYFDAPGHFLKAAYKKMSLLVTNYNILISRILTKHILFKIIKHIDR